MFVLREQNIAIIICLIFIQLAGKTCFNLFEPCNQHWTWRQARADLGNVT